MHPCMQRGGEGFVSLLIISASHKFNACDVGKSQSKEGKANSSTGGECERSREAGAIAHARLLPSSARRVGSGCCRGGGARDGFPTSKGAASASGLT